MKWLRKAAERGGVTAQSYLGHMYVTGQGVPQDDVQAYAWLNLAAAQSNALDAQAWRDRIAESMTREEISRAQQLARDYWDAYVLPFRN